jgi:hypothetical protein
MQADVGPIHEHPAPHRNRINVVLLLAGLAASPFGWVLQMVVGYGLASYVCFPNDAPFEQPPWTGETGVLVAINLVCLAMAIGGGVLSLAHWRRVREEKPGDAHDLLNAGEGRTRFLAGCGILLSVGFSAAILFNTVNIVAVPTCWRMAP